MRRVSKWVVILIIIIIAAISGVALYVGSSFVISNVTGGDVAVVNHFRAVVTAILAMITGIAIFLWRNHFSEIQ